MLDNTYASQPFPPALRFMSPLLLKPTLTVSNRCCPSWQEKPVTIEEEEEEKEKKSGEWKREKLKEGWKERENVVSVIEAIASPACFYFESMQ